VGASYLSWMALFLCFFGWFGLAPLMPIIPRGSVAITVLARLFIGWHAIG